MNKAKRLLFTAAALISLSGVVLAGCTRVGSSGTGAGGPIVNRGSGGTSGTQTGVNTGAVPAYGTSGSGGNTGSTGGPGGSTGGISTGISGKPGTGTGGGTGATGVR